MDSSSLKYPIYIISKGRWENPLTAKFLMKENIPFTIAVEPQEYKNYMKTIPEKYIKALPFSNLGLGSYPARNWCWEDSIEKGKERHFLFDDNIYGFAKLYQGNDPKKKALKVSSLKEIWPQYVRNVWRYGRPHHQVSWQKYFKHPLKRREVA